MERKWKLAMVLLLAVTLTAGVAVAQDRPRTDRPGDRADQPDQPAGPMGPMLGPPGGGGTMGPPGSGYGPGPGYAPPMGPPASSGQPGVYGDYYGPPEVVGAYRMRALIGTVQDLRGVAADPAAAGIVAISSLREEARDPRQAVEELEGLLRETRSLPLRNAIRMTLRDLYKAQGQPDRARQTLREMLRENDQALQEQRPPLRPAGGPPEGRIILEGGDRPEGREVAPGRETPVGPPPRTIVPPREGERPREGGRGQ